MSCHPERGEPAQRVRAVEEPALSLSKGPPSEARGASSLLLALLLATPLSAQQLVVHVRAAESGRPIAGAVVSVLDSAGTTRGEGLTSADGTWRARVALATRARFRVRRIGFAPHFSEWHRVDPARLLEVTLRVPADRITLAKVVVTARGKRCSRQDLAATEAGALWDQIHTALAATEASRLDALVRTSVRTHESWLDRQGNVESTRLVGTTLSGAVPFATRSPDSLSRFGYAEVARDGEGTYYGPDARLLLSPQFLAEHCFWLERGRGATAGLVGLGFAPVDGRRVPDIAGTLWVDEATSALRFLDYRYENLRLPAPAKLTGGRVVFEALPSGAWMVRSFSIRMPRFRQYGERPGPLTLGGYVLASGDAAVLGQVNPIRMPAPPTPPSRPTSTGRVVGVVFDSLLGAPLAGATVSVARSSLRTRTDDAGRFVLEAVPDGFRHLAIAHPALDSLGLRDLGREIEVRAGESVEHLFATPSLRTLKRGACADSSLVLATIRDVATDAPIAGATLTVRWTEQRRVANRMVTLRPDASATADSAGMVFACLPRRSDLSARASHGPFATGYVDMAIGPRGVALLDLRLERDSARLRAGGTTTLRTGASSLEGVVRDERGRPVAGAIVAFDDLDVEGRTSEDGRFAIHYLPTGSWTIEVRRLGYARARVAVTLSPRAVTRAEVRLEAATALPAVEVRERATPAPPMLREFEERRRLGGGFALGPEEMKRRENVAMRSILGEIPSVMIEFHPMDGGSGRGPAEFRPGEMKLHFNGTGGVCMANVYIDDVLRKADDLQFLNTKDVVAIEVYPRSSVAPQKYVKLRNGCGVILVWTRQQAGW